MNFITVEEYFFTFLKIRHWNAVKCNLVHIWTFTQPPALENRQYFGEKGDFERFRNSHPTHKCGLECKVCKISKIFLIQFFGTNNHILFSLFLKNGQLHFVKDILGYNL